MMKVCVVGAGIAGLCATKHAIQNGLETVVFEQNNEIGGTWIYTDLTGEDEFGVEIHSSMYKGLRTNLPKEIMGFPDFPYPDQDSSYIFAEDVLEFMKLYAAKFNLIKFIKFKHLVLRIIPKNDKWQIMVKDLLNDNVITCEFDYVLICNGHYQSPIMPNIPGMENFTGIQIHSHNFRCSSEFKGLKVLIIGGGPSALDIVIKINEIAKKTTLSHHMDIKYNFPESVQQKPDVIKLNDSHVIFADETIEEIDAIIYCTGYNYSFPFLSTDCGIYIEDNCVQSLYKQCINIKYPTMAFLGLLKEIQIGQSIDIQVRFIMTYLTGKNKLPSSDEMMKITNREIQERLDKGWSKKRGHTLHTQWQKIYYDDLSEIAGIENIAPVMLKLYNETATDKYLQNYTKFHDNNFKILDNDTFIKI